MAAPGRSAPCCGADALTRCHMRLLLASLSLIAVEVGFILLAMHARMTATRDILGVGLLLGLGLFLAYAASIKRC